MNPDDKNKAENEHINAEPEQEKSTAKKGDSEDNYMTLGMCLGMCLGMTVGQLVFDNMATGMSVGMCLGMAIGISTKKKK